MAHPFHTFLWKIASRCNLDCSYCFVYNRGDQQWRRQPKFMAIETAERIAGRMSEHFQAHGKSDAAIVFHGGEPLLAGADRIERYADVIGRAFSATDVDLTVGMQSNGLLFDRRIGDVLVNRGITIGISLDGSPLTNDKHRLDRRGRPTGARLEERLEILLSSDYKRLFTGFLCVIDVDSNPVETLDYLLSYNPPSIDFLLPLDNHDRLPPGKVSGEQSSPYGDWLIRAFDHWLEVKNDTEVRIFDTLIGLLLGAPSTVETFGVDPVDLIVVETNGEIEAVDSLKAVFNGATRLGFDVVRHSFDEVSRDIAVRARQSGIAGLCKECQSCEIVSVCGGGYLPHRYSRSNGFDNPSVYCSDLMVLIRHIHGRLIAERRPAA